MYLHWYASFSHIENVLNYKEPAKVANLMHMPTSHSYLISDLWKTKQVLLHLNSKVCSSFLTSRHITCQLSPYLLLKYLLAITMQNFVIIWSLEYFGKLNPSPLLLTDNSIFHIDISIIPNQFFYFKPLFGYKIVVFIGSNTNQG